MIRDVTLFIEISASIRELRRILSLFEMTPSLRRLKGFSVPPSEELCVDSGVGILVRVAVEMFWHPLLFGIFQVTDSLALVVLVVTATCATTPLSQSTLQQTSEPPTCISREPLHQEPPI